MEKNLVFIPVLLQILLTIILYIALVIAKSRAIKQGLVNESRRSLYDDAWPESVLKISNNIRNQFEVPVLFYVLVILSWSLNSVNFYIHFIAWAFVLSRIVHSFIHTGSNYVPLRRNVFLIGCILVASLCIIQLIGLIHA